MQRFILILLALVLCPSLAFARSWTNREGKEIVADFVDATEEKVTLKKSDGKVVTFKLELLCESDQAFIRGILARRVGKNIKKTPMEEPGSPFETVPSSTPKATASKPNDLRSAFEPKGDDEKVEGLGTMRDVNETKKKMKIENREWTDGFGNKTAGKFIRFQGNNVLVLRSGRQVSLDYWQLSETDHEYLSEMCEAYGQSHLIPKVNPATRNNAPNTAVAGGPPPAGVANPMTAFAGNTATTTPPPQFSPFVPRNDNPEELARKMRKLEEQARAAPYTPPPSSVATSTPSYPSSPMTTYPSSPMTTYSPPPGSSYTPPPGSTYPSPGLTTGGMPAMPSSTMPSSTYPSMPPPTIPSIPNHTFTPPSMSMEKQCENCGKVLPGSTTAGDRCPGCGVYFSVDRTTGKTASGGGWGSGGGGGSSRGVIRGIIVLAVLAVKAVAYMAWRSQQS